MKIERTTPSRGSRAVGAAAYARRSETAGKLEPAGIVASASVHGIPEAEFTPSVRDAINFLVDHGYSAAPVIDESGRAVGVVSRSDILVHDRERAEHAVPEYYHRSDLATAEGELLPKGFQVEAVDRTTVEEIMTPTVFAVTPARPISRASDFINAMTPARAAPTTDSPDSPTRDESPTIAMIRPCPPFSRCGLAS